MRFGRNTEKLYRDVITREMTFELSAPLGRITVAALKGMIARLEAAGAPIGAEVQFDGGHVTVRWKE